MAKLSKKAAPKAKTTETKGTKTESKKVEEQVVEAAAKPVEEKVEKAAPKKITTKVEPKKIVAKEEAKKITVAKEPEKIAAAKEPEKIVLKDEPAKAEVKKAAEKPVKKAAVKKAATKKVSESKEESTSVETASKTSKKVVEKPVKKAVSKKKADQAKLDHYQTLPLEECIRLMQTMQVHYNYDDYYKLLLDEADLAKLEKDIIAGNKIKEQKYSFEEVGCDEDLVMVTLNKVGDTMDIKAADYKEMKKQIGAALKFKMSDDAESNAAEYLDEFKLCEKILMIGQRKQLYQAADITELLGADVNAYFQHFFDFAYALLPSWQYNDVKFYEDFAYAVLSQFTDLYNSDQLRIQIDVADLYILHGDFQHGDELYGYILRDNQIKDFIYYRYASVYKDIDYNKAKSIAYSSLQYVDDRYTYYPNIMEIINN